MPRLMASVRDFFNKLGFFCAGSPAQVPGQWKLKPVRGILRRSKPWALTYCPPKERSQQSLQNVGSLFAIVDFYEGDPAGYRVTHF